ncbi:hypothetical protein QE361_002777 [Sphingomonas sp. SORGH_AS802]|nr:hypothetical protein [Sphingomonas sp. SORGH_AS_0438]MDR6135778.1 hypothetical protein [Sphingomonas sp. SORGH_AS_0802]
MGFARIKAPRVDQPRLTQACPLRVCVVRCSVFARRLGTNSIILEAGPDADRRLKQAFEAAVLARALKTHRAAF